VKAAHWSSQEENRNAFFEISARSGRPASAYDGDFSGQTLKYRNSPLIDDYLLEQYRRQARQAREYGLIRRDVSIDGWFDPQFLQAAVKQLGLEHYWPRYDAAGKPQDKA
jgi:sulfonate transport system substrate-binding protein